MNERIPNAPTPETDTASDAAPLGYLSEMFCSVQGEGPYTGERQVFVRTAGCAATCWWCDTVYSKVRTPRFVIHGDPGRVLRNPLALDAVVAEVVAFARGRGGVETVSITGGEPLEQPAFVVPLARRLREHGHRIYLETAGLHAGAFAEVLPHVDVVAMDIKLPSAVGRDAWDEHAAFLSVARGTAFDPERGAGRTLFVKVVVAADSSLEEVARAAAIVADAGSGIPFILQPESSQLYARGTKTVAGAAVLERVEAAFGVASERLENVRVMSQSHKLLGVR
jgi:organic radical activating enzyme